MWRIFKGWHLYLAISPFQVNPPRQELNNPGGVVKVQKIKISENHIMVNNKYTLLAQNPAQPILIPLKSSIF